MRVLIEILVAAALIALVWEKSLKERASELPWVGDKIAPALKTAAQPQPKPQPRLQPRPIVTPAPTASGAWMWDPSHHNPLDRPSPSATPTAAITSEIRGQPAKP